MKRKRVTALLMAAAMVWTMPAEAVMATDLEFTDVSAEDDFVEDVGTEASDEPVSEGITDVEGTSEDSEAQGFSDDAAADVFGPGEETGDEGAGGEETEGEGAEVYEDSYDIPERFDVLPGWNRWISRSIGCSIWDEESQEWIEEEVPVTGMEALSLNADDPNGEPVIELTEDEDGDGWNVHALQMGHAVLKATYQLFGSQETREQEIHVWVSGDVWGTDIVSDTADHVLLPGDSMKLSAQVWRDSYDEEQGHHEGDTSQVTYKWEVAHGEYAISVKDKDGNDVTGEDIQRTEITGKEITIKANEDAGDAAAGIRMTAYDGEDEIGSSFFDLHIREGYYRLTPVEISSLEVGETITVDPILEWYESGKDPVIVEVSSYSWDWDSNALDIEDADGKLLTYETRDEDGNLLTDDDREGKAPFTITRKGDWDTNLSLTAMMEGEDGALEYAADRGYHLDGLDYNIWIEFGEGQYRNYIYSTEESVSIPLNDENIRDYEKCQVRWYAVVEGEEENDPPVHDLINEGRAAVAEDNKSITIDGTKLLTGDNPLSLEDCIHVYAEVQVGENTLSSTDWGRDWTFLEIREPWEEYDIPKDISMLPHWDEWISKGIRYSANNADFPEGFESEIPITGMEALSLNADDPNGEPVIELTEGEDGDGWNVHALQIGHAVLKATYQLFGSQETREQEIHVWVSGDVWGTNIVSDTAGHELLPGASMKLSAQVWRDSYSEEQGHHEGDTSDVKCQWQVEYGGDGIQVSAKEGREITVTAKTGVGDVDAGIRMTAYDGEDEIGSSFFDLHIREGYYRLTPVEISSLEVGETITVDP
ncbi:MAG: hypothetical protein Q4D55_11445, partial [Eubacteriales bacterium]|nr:hypothetical protein [Eubacteriales bacterium]